MDQIEQNLKIYKEYSKYITNNKNYSQQSNYCSCIKCKSTFLSTLVTSFRYKMTTAVCPQCNEDVIIPHSLYIPSINDLDRWNENIYVDAT
jgi:NAD-dependent SIR2 family protein deacetylase